MSELPFISCLCPTYCRPEQLARVIAHFDRQSYPAERRELVILDDSPGHEGGWRLLPGFVRHFGVSQRIRSLAEKYARLVAMAQGSLLAIWEDDDDYLPDHLLHHVGALIGREWSKPSRVLSDYADPPRLGEERADGRFFASIAFRRALFERVGGFVPTARADFDQQFLARLAAAGPPGDPCDFGPPQYVYRWHTGAPHAQGFMRGPADEEWYDRAGTALAAPFADL